MVKITIEPGKPAKILKPKQDFRLEEIELTFKIVGLSVLSNTLDYQFPIVFLNDAGTIIYSTNIYLRHPHYYLEWEINPLDVPDIGVLRERFSKIKISSAVSNPKAVMLEIDFTRK